MASTYRRLTSVRSTIALVAATAPLLSTNALAQFINPNPAQALNPVTGVPVDRPSNFVGSAAAGVTDPGIRSGAAGAGGALPGLGPDELNFFTQARVRFQEVDSVSGTIEAGNGLGPAFNGNSCAQCHAFPAVGGTSPPTTNPQVALATLDGATNTVPPFVANGGPVREARFIRNPDGTADGGVHDLYTITGRSDATNQPNANTGTNTSCTLPQTDFSQAIAGNNIIFRIPTPTFGGGMVENIGDRTLVASAAAAAAAGSSLGITTGRFNHSGNDGTITRFGWKAQNKSLMVFAGEAYNVEQGVTNENFQNERTGNVDCYFNQTPEDSTNLVNTRNTNSPASDYSSDIVNFAAFMRLSNQPTPAAPTFSTMAGRTAFQNIGCGICHTPTLTTDASIFTNQSGKAANAFSDFALHEMGSVLADHISQGGGDGDDFRSAPLWGIGQRAFFLHDGRTKSLVTAIEDHASYGSEANQVVENFNDLPPQQQQNIINFLRSL